MLTANSSSTRDSRLRIATSRIVRLEEAGADLEQALDLRQRLLVGHEHDDVVLGADYGVVVRHDDLVAAHHRANGGAGRQLDYVDTPVGQLAGFAVAVNYRFQRLGGAAPQA